MGHVQVLGLLQNAVPVAGWVAARHSASLAHACVPRPLAPCRRSIYNLPHEVSHQYNEVLFSAEAGGSGGGAM